MRRPWKLSGLSGGIYAPASVSTWSGSSGEKTGAMDQLVPPPEEHVFQAEWRGASPASSSCAAQVALALASTVKIGEMGYTPLSTTETTYVRFGISYFHFMVRLQCRSSLYLSWRKTRGQLVVCRRNVLRTTRGCQLLLSLHFLWRGMIHQQNFCIL